MRLVWEMLFLVCAVAFMAFAVLTVIVAARFVENAAGGWLLLGTVPAMGISLALARKCSDLSDY